MSNSNLQSLKARSRIKEHRDNFEGEIKLGLALFLAALVQKCNNVLGNMTMHTGVL